LDLQGGNDNEVSPQVHERRVGAKQEMDVAATLPVVISTWGFRDANLKAWEVLSVGGGTALDAVEVGARTCEELQCDTTVGFGGSPDEEGETTLDAMIMDGERHAVGAVGCLRRVKNAVGVARHVLEHTKHTLLVGELATSFAIGMGFPEEDLTTDDSRLMHEEWKARQCQPNFWRNTVNPDPTTACGPYRPNTSHRNSSESETMRQVDRYNHDTIGIVAIDKLGRIASATSSNGARFKIPGRVGDAPITGAGSYVDRDIGGAAATGDGDVMARFLPSLLTVEYMGTGMEPKVAASAAIAKIAKYYPSFSGAVVAVNLKGVVGAACHNILPTFPYTVSSLTAGPGTIYTELCSTNVQ